MISNTKITAGDLMRSKLITLHPKDKLERVKQIFDDYSFRHIPIVVGGKVQGIISKSDFLHIEGTSRDSFDKFLNSKRFKMHTVDEYMKAEVVCCKLDTPLLNLTKLFLANEIHSVLVVDDEELVGIVTPQDILRWLHNEIE
ncbi:CBS domain-containing protein [Portibacter lacus]|uniref:CBS domain-containing protein n=1 Tax=Portibacter lacus TaxID=1099794 RepID=A0AA37SPA5_9BACT|nr:CBS domain-containing protein [Portibacter lacus]GLR17194.1 hypothetical protein GCM10007940_18090 [Portibacter lacus]